MVIVASVSDASSTLCVTALCQPGATAASRPEGRLRRGGARTGGGASRLPRRGSRPSCSVLGVAPGPRERGAVGSRGNFPLAAHRCGWSAVGVSVFPLWTRPRDPLARRCRAPAWSATAMIVAGSHGRAWVSSSSWRRAIDGRAVRAPRRFGGVVAVLVAMLLREGGGRGQQCIGALRAGHRCQVLRVGRRWCGVSGFARRSCEFVRRV